MESKVSALHPTSAMRIGRLSLILPVLLALAACEGGTLPATDPIHGSWSTPMSLFLGTGHVDRAEHRFVFRPDGTYLSSTIGWDGSRVVYEGQMTGEYRLEPGGVATNVRSWRWRSVETSGWQDELVGDRGTFGSPTRYTVDGDRLIMHHGPSVGEHGQPIPAEDKVYRRR